MKEPNLCLICGKPIWDRPASAKYHTGECTLERNRRKWYEKQGTANQAWREPRPCEICETPFTPRARGQRTCGNKPCVNALKRKTEALRKQGIYQRPGWGADAVPAVGFQMPDPWPDLDTLPSECRSWYQAEMMPLL